MTATLLAISAAYVVMGVLLLSMGLSSPFAWWVKAGVIVLASAFFVEVFFATKGLLGWPGEGALPPKFQLLWTRVVEPDAATRDPGAIFIWIEEVDANDVPTGTPRAYRLKYAPKLAERTLKARDEIMAGHPQQGVAEDLEEAEGSDAQMNANANNNREQGDGGFLSTGGQVDLPDTIKNVPQIAFRPMPGPSLPPKP